MRVAGILIGFVLLLLVILQLTTDYALSGRLPVIGGVPNGSSSAARTSYVSQSLTEPFPPPTHFPSFSRSIESDLGLENPWSLAIRDEITGFADESFERLWMRTDEPVRDLNIVRSWIWGPEPLTGGIEEEWLEAGSGTRLVQYFPKGRMESRSGSDDAPPWLPSSGLLVSEMVNGRYQIGVDTYTDAPAAPDVPVAGDAATSGIPSYADINRLELPDRSARSSGETIDEVIVDGRIQQDERYRQWGVTAGELLHGTRHAIADVFGSYLEAEGTVYEDGRFVSAPLFEHRLQLVGFPITDAYWALVEVDGVPQDVLWQCFERRCLTYVPASIPGSQLESGDAGLHYYQWRYGALDRAFGIVP